LTNGDTASAEVIGANSVVVVDTSKTDWTPGDRSQPIRNIRLSVLGHGDRLTWPGPEVTVNPRKSPTDPAYQSIPSPSPNGILQPYGGRLHDILGFLLVDNDQASSVTSPVTLPDGSQRLLRFTQDDETSGYWAYLDGTYDSYTVLNVRLDILPVQSEPDTGKQDPS